MKKIRIRCWGPSGDEQYDQVHPVIEGQEISITFHENVNAKTLDLIRGGKKKAELKRTFRWTVELVD